jgi:hypothetical protein
VFARNRFSTEPIRRNRCGACVSGTSVKRDHGCAKQDRDSFREWRDGLQITTFPAATDMDLLDPRFFRMLKAASMKRRGLLKLAILGLTILAEGRAMAGSAVVSGPFGEHVIVANEKYSKDAAIKKALALWHHQWTGTPKILASSDVVGEGAVAGWNNGKAWAIGASAGKATAAQAEAEAIKFCLQHCPKGAKPTILRRFRG